MLLITSVTTCKNTDTVESRLAGSEPGKYWDLIYKGDSIPTKTLLNPDPEYCIFLKKPNKIVHYQYEDPFKVIDRGCFTDVKFNPDTFAIKNDSIVNFLGDDYHIKLLTDDSMILKRCWTSGLHKGLCMFYMYKKSRIQDKKIFVCKY